MLTTSFASVAPPSDYKYKFLEDVYIELGSKSSEIVKLVYTVFQKHIDLTGFLCTKQRAYINLLQTPDKNKFEFDVDNLMGLYICQMLIF